MSIAATFATVLSVGSKASVALASTAIIAASSAGSNLAKSPILEAVQPAPTQVVTTVRPEYQPYEFVIIDPLFDEVQYKFKGKMPGGTTITEESNGSTVVMRNARFTMEFRAFYEAEPVHFISVADADQHSQLGKYYRVRLEDDSKTYYVNRDSGISIEKDCEYTGATIPAPCGTNVMQIKESRFFWLSCEAAQADSALCDKIVQSMRVEVL